MDEMEELKREFLEECVDILDRLRDALRGIAEAPDKPDRLAELFRGIHTIKGGAAMFEMGGVTELAHKTETALGKFSKAPDTFGEAHQEKMFVILDRLESLLGLSDGRGVAGTAAAVVEMDDAPQAAKTAAPASAPKQAPAPQAVAPQAPKAPQEAEARPKAATDETIRVPLARIQKSFDIISEIFLLRNQMTFLVDQMVARDERHEEFHANWEALNNSLRKSIGELENIAMSMRMTPVKNLFKRMEQTVRAYAETSGKQIKVEIRGEETELDKKIVDTLAEPLVHLIRNAMDHGIEPQAERKALGKAPSGTISLSAEVRGNEVVLAIADDGRGIDHEKVLDSARKKGLDVSRVQTPEQAFELIFMPGFSTAEAVSEVSGRGIGMDAVKSYVEGIGGTISLNTKVGSGTTFLLNLPLGMSVLPAILVRVNEQRFAVSINEVVETRRVPRDAILINGRELYYEHKGRLIPCVRLDRHLGNPPADDVVARELPLCVVRTGEREEVAFCVTELEANTEVVAKPLPAAAPKLHYVTGAAVLVSGEPAFVLALGKWYQHFKKSSEESHGYGQAA